MSIVTWSPINKGTGVVLSNDNLTATISQRYSVIATEGKSKGKWYWEVACDSSSSNLYTTGISIKNANMSTSWDASNSGGYYGGTGYTYGLSSLLAEGNPYGASFSAGDIIGVLLDIDNKTINFSKNGALQGELEYIVTGDEIYPMISRATSSGSAVMTANFGDTPFKYPVPTGYKAYQQVNKTFILSEGEYKNYVDGDWYDVTSTPPTLAQFQDEGIDDLSILDRKAQLVGASPQVMSNEGTLGEGKVFKGAVDLKKYFDLRKIEVK